MRHKAKIAVVKPRDSLLDQVDYRLAQAYEDKEEIYNLRYRAYLREGAVKESPAQRVTDQYDDLPNSWIFGVYLMGELYSSLRISVLTSEWRESYSAEAFGEILYPRLDRGEVIIDPTRFVADPDKVKRFPELAYLTLRIAFMACEYFNADLGIASVRAEHQGFYRRVFSQATIAEPRMFPGLLKPVGLMAADFQNLKEKVSERYPVMRSTVFERRMLFTRNSGQAPSEDLRLELQKRLHGDPALALCLKILDHLSQVGPQSLNFSNLTEVVGKKRVDSEMLRALMVLTASERAVLELMGKFIDDDGNEYLIAPRILSATLRSGQFVHPKNQILVEDFERKLILYFVPTSAFLASSSVRKHLTPTALAHS